MIRLRGARAHNLKSIDLDLPDHRLIVVAGPSGSGKSTLLFDLLHREGLRRFVEAQGGDLARRFGAEMTPDVDEIEGLPPTMALRPQAGSASSRSTVGTLSETVPLLRRLFASFGKLHCEVCGRELRGWGADEAARDWIARAEGERIRVLVSAERLGLQGEEWRSRAQAAGFVRMRWGGEDRDLSVWTPEKELPPRAMVVIDRLRADLGSLSRLRDALENGFRWGKGVTEGESEGGTPFCYTSEAFCPEHGKGVARVSPALFSFNHPDGACTLCGGSGAVEERRGESAVCTRCDGDGIDPRSDGVRLGGETFRRVCRWDGEELLQWLEVFRGELSKNEEPAGRLIERVTERIRLLNRLGLGHLQLGRRGNALSGGELFRVRLAAQLAARVTGLLILGEEPLAGLHPDDGARIREELLRLKQNGNTVAITEHIAAAMEQADWIVELGPVGGRSGGELLYSGPREGWESAERSVTLPYLHKPVRVPRLSPRKGGAAVVLRGASGRNLQGVDLEVPLGVLTVVSGVSGSGKSSLVIGTLAPALRREKERLDKGAAPLPFRSLEGEESVGGIRLLKQGVLSGPRSTVGTALGVWDRLREMLSQTPEARVRGWSPGRFSLNVKGGRCERCSGTGELWLDAEALPDLCAPCPACGGDRFEPATLEVKLKGLTAADLLRLEGGEALRVFRQWPSLAKLLQAMSDVGLGYLPLGQPVERLSAGEGQRLRLAAELGKGNSFQEQRRGKPLLYLLDEPARGLHFSEAEQLLRIFRKLTEAGHGVVIVEHREEILAAADRVVELGPGGGRHGGRVVAIRQNGV